MVKQLIAITLLVVFSFLMVFSFLERQDKVPHIQAQQLDTMEVSAFVGEYHFSLFGYTSPHALVTIEGMGIYDQTYADSKGFFSFANRWSPLSPREACISSQDQFGRVSAPVCLPPFPTSRDVNIGPVILPPSISVDKENYYIGDQVILSGQTIPNTDVNLALFTQKSCAVVRITEGKNQSILSSIISNLSSIVIKPVEGCEFPNVTTLADNRGNFSMVLPSQQKDTYRVFSNTTYQEIPSPKSITLNLDIQPLWMIIFQLLRWLFNFLRPHLLELLISIELIIIGIYILRRHLPPHIIVKEKALALRSNLLPEKMPEEALVVINHKP